MQRLVRLKLPLTFRGVAHRASRLRAGRVQVPWEFGFQLNERYLKWHSSAQAQLAKLVVMEKLNITTDDLETRLDELTAVLPDLTTRLDTLTAELLTDLLREPRDVASRVLALKTALPNLDLAQAVRRYPELVARFSRSALLDRVERWIAALDGDAFAVGELLTKEPRCIHVDLDVALQEVQRLMPDCRSPLKAFLSTPGQFLTMEQLGLESSNVDPKF